MSINGRKALCLYQELRYVSASIIIQRQSKMIQSRELRTHEKTEKFFRTVQAGDIALFNLFEEVIAVFGFTKVGKTTSCHMLCGSPLRGENLRGQLIFRSSGNRFMTARIGNTTDSQTQIPNIFEGTIREPGVVPAKTKRIIVLDQPGYGDTYGFHRIFSNGYFHYRTFSKTPKLKFVLAFKKDDLIGTGEYFKKTIFNFINTFKDWESVKDDILKATSFLVTKADVNTKLQNLKAIVTNLRDSTGNMGSKQIQKYQEMIDSVLAADRLFFIEKPKDHFNSRVEDKILQQIYQRSSFWERPVLGNRNVVDMSPINFSVAKEIISKLRDTDNELFREEFDDFMSQISRRIKDIITEDKASLANIINTLKNDSVSKSEDRQFLIDMGQFVTKYYKFNEDYKTKREETQISLFRSQEGGRWTFNNNQDLQREMRGLYFIKKFKVLQYLQQISKQLDDNFRTERTIEELQEFSSLFIAIFRKFSILRVSANDNDKSIYKYSYIIQRIIEESKILTLILFSNEAIKQEIDKLQVQLPTDVYFVIKDEIITLVIGEIRVDRLKEEFIGNLNFDDLKVINQETILFFEGITNKEEKVQVRIAQLVIEFSSGILKSDRIPLEQDVIFAGQKLYQYRNKFYAHLQNIQDDGLSQSSKERTIELVVQLTNILAKILQQYFNKFDEARQCYQSVNNAESVFQIFQKQLIAESSSTQAQRTISIKYAEMAGYFNRRELALKCLQKAYALSTSYVQMKQASTKIVDLITDKKDDKENPYLAKFLNAHFCEDFSADLRENLKYVLKIELL